METGAGHVRRQGSVVIVDLEALTRERRNKLFADITVVRDVHARTQWKATCHTSLPFAIGLLRRDRERKTRDRVRERRYVTSLLETLVSPMSGGTESCEGVTTSRLQDWQSIRLKKAITGVEMGDATPQEPRPQLNVVSNEDQSKNVRTEDDGILLVVPARDIWGVKYVHLSTVAQRGILFPRPA